MSLTIQNLTKTYGANIAVNDISFRIDSGEVVGFLGPNGAGKSTTMKIITGCISADSGTVLINGTDIATGGTALKHAIGYLPENNPLYLNMYVREYLEYAAMMYMPQSETLSAVNYAVDAVGLGEHQYKKIGELSKGYRQRTGIARAMVHNPQILILDEPTTGLDPNQIVEIRSLIKELDKEKTVILSTHIMQEAEAVCDRAIIIRKGNIVADDSIAALKAHNSRSTIIVEFDGEVSAESLQSIPGISAVQQDGKQWQLTVSDGDDTQVRRAVFQFAAQNAVPLLELRRQSSSLENIFHELTF
ncbi:MAG: ATP-binding cassette domain-containing protein [Bacteroidales bacterium]|nr:ATP-binding cassette domain-containing protein [Bacteroidales bacterium]